MHCPIPLDITRLTTGERGFHVHQFIMQLCHMHGMSVEIAMATPKNICANSKSVPNIGIL